MRSKLEDLAVRMHRARAIVRENRSAASAPMLRVGTLALTMYTAAEIKAAQDATSAARIDERKARRAFWRLAKKLAEGADA